MAHSSLPSRRQHEITRIALGVLAVTVMWLGVSSYRNWQARFEELTAIARTTGIADRRPSLVERMRRDAGPTRASLRLARALLADELDQRWILDLQEGEREKERERGLERLDIAHRLGLESLAERPASWEALVVIGGSEYLRMSRRRDPGLMSHREQWLAPLEEAHRLAPLQPEPLRLLAATDLGNWSILSAEDRRQATERLRRAFEDATTFDLLSLAWLRVAPSLNEALAIVPEQLGAWTGLTQHFARSEDWERYCDARERLLAVSRSYSEERLLEGEARLRQGDRRKGLLRLLWVGAKLAPDGANLEIIERLLAVMPPGTASEASDRWLRAWLDWTLDRCLDPSGCPMSAESLRRLLSLNREVSPEDQAWALAAAGALREAEVLERAHRKGRGGTLTLDWTPYVLTKARLLAVREERREALQLLQEVPLLGRDSMRYWETYRSVAQAAGDDLEAAAADAWLSTRERRQWTAEDWARTRAAAELELWAAVPAEGVRLEIQSAGADGGIWLVRWDGSEIESLPAAEGRVVEIALPVTAGRHHLEIRAGQNARVPTAIVRLLRSSP